MVKLSISIGLGLMIASAASASTPNAQSSNKPASQAQEMRYCLKLERATGSNIDRSGCRTKAEWRRLGIDIDDLLQH